MGQLPTDFNPLKTSKESFGLFSKNFISVMTTYLSAFSLKYSRLAFLSFILFNFTGVLYGNTLNQTIKIDQLILGFEPILYRLSKSNNSSDDLLLKKATINLNGTFLSDSNDKLALYAIKYGDIVSPHAIQEVIIQHNFDNSNEPSTTPTPLSTLSTETLVDLINKTKDIINKNNSDTKKLILNMKLLVVPKVSGGFNLTPVDANYSPKSLKKEMVHLLKLEFSK